MNVERAPKSIRYVACTSCSPKLTPSTHTHLGQGGQAKTHGARLLATTTGARPAPLPLPSRRPRAPPPSTYLTCVQRESSTFPTALHNRRTGHPKAAPPPPQQKLRRSPHHTVACPATPSPSRAGRSWITPEARSPPHARAASAPLGQAARAPVASNRPPLCLQVAWSASPSPPKASVMQPQPTGQIASCPTPHPRHADLGVHPTRVSGSSTITCAASTSQNDRLIKVAAHGDQGGVGNPAIAQPTAGKHFTGPQAGFRLPAPAPRTRVAATTQQNTRA